MYVPEKGSKSLAWELPLRSKSISATRAGNLASRELHVQAMLPAQAGHAEPAGWVSARCRYIKASGLCSTLTAYGTIAHRRHPIVLLPTRAAALRPRCLRTAAGDARAHHWQGLLTSHIQCTRLPLPAVTCSGVSFSRLRFFSRFHSLSSAGGRLDCCPAGHHTSSASCSFSLQHSAASHLARSVGLRAAAW